MTFMALLWAAALAWSLATGNAIWLRRRVTRADAPAAYWTSVAIYAAMMALFFALGPVR